MLNSVLPVGGNRLFSKSAMLGERGGVGAFTPASLTPLVWLDATQMGLSNNAAVSSFTDYSGNNRHFVQASGTLQPLYKTSGINSLAAVEADGVDDAMTLAAFGAQATWWGWITFRPVTMAATKELWSIEDFPASTTYKLLETNAATTININNPGGNLTPNLTIASGTNYTFYVQGDLTNMTIVTGAGATASLTLPGTGTSRGDRANSGMRLFARGDPGLYFNVRIGELIFGSGTLTAGQKSAAWAYLNTKWGTGLGA